VTGINSHFRPVVLDQAEMRRKEKKPISIEKNETFRWAQGSRRNVPAISIPCEILLKNSTNQIFRLRFAKPDPQNSSKWAIVK